MPRRILQCTCGEFDPEPVTVSVYRLDGAFIHRQQLCHNCASERVDATLCVECRTETATLRITTFTQIQKLGSKILCRSCAESLKLVPQLTQDPRGVQ